MDIYLALICHFGLQYFEVLLNWAHWRLQALVSEFSFYHCSIFFFSLSICFILSFFLVCKVSEIIYYLYSFLFYFYLRTIPGGAQCIIYNAGYFTRVGQMQSKCYTCYISISSVCFYSIYLNKYEKVKLLLGSFSTWVGHLIKRNEFMLILHKSLLPKFDLRKHTESIK